MDPIYTLSFCEPAYQLRWSLALFPNTPVPPSHSWQTELNVALATDGIRVLDSNRSAKDAILLLLSTQPHVKPLTIVQRVKGRLQHQLRSQSPVAFRRNFRLTTVGDANITTVENYVAKQLAHHKMAAELSQQKLADAAWEDSQVKLAEPIYSSHGQYVLGLHLVLVHAERWNCASASFLKRTQDGILATAKKYGCGVSRLSILADHLHATLKFHYDLAPGEIAIACMNNIAHCHDMLPLWTNSFYVGTIGSYDMNAVRS